MNRRQFLSRSSTLMLSTGALHGLSVRALAADCDYFTGHLKGLHLADSLLASVFNSGATAAVSSTGQFHHFHYLYIPQAILENPPAEGWSTITTMMMPGLGMDPFFFRRNERPKQYHCHQVYISNRQLNAIANGERIVVTAYINLSGAAVPNHTFIFNEAGINQHNYFTEQQENIKAESQRRGLATNYVNRCYPVRVFNGKGFTRVTDKSRLTRLQGY